MKNTIKLLLVMAVILCIFIPESATYGVNILTAQDPTQYGSKPGYIDQAILIVEPHGAYVEQSLYLKYSDHGQYSSGKQIEIVHRFELPQGSVVNDLWLWIGDSIMQAIMKDTWTARAIYDSIVSVRRDPAFLSKKGNQYELHIYPLQSGSFRKIKLNFITPTTWLGNSALAVLPLPMLNANNVDTKPIDVLFRSQNNRWEEPKLREFPESDFVFLKDTLNYQYKVLKIADISELAGLTINFETQFDDGFFYQSFKSKQDDLSYFQIGINSQEFFGLKMDSTSYNILVGLDLSGTFNKNLNRLLPNISKTLKSALKDDDKLNLMVVGAGKFQNFSTEYLPASAIDSYLNEFLYSDLAKEISNNKMPHIVYCDWCASQCWQFPGIDEIATWERHSNIVEATSRFKNADIIAAYEHGHDNVLHANQLNTVVSALDTFFTNGGRLLSFYDYNRIGKEILASHYIPGLTTRTKIQGDLYRNVDGNIGIYFPESIYHHVINLLEYNEDQEVKIELMDSQGRPAVISKKIKNGLLVVSGLWSFTDDGALRAQLGIPLLGLSSLTTHRQLAQLLEEMQQIHATAPYEKAIIFSNSDSLIEAESALNWATDYINNFGDNPPVFYTVNLLDGSSIQPPYITENEIDYYGSGYLLKILADKTEGLHLETHINSWDVIAGYLNPYRVPPIKTFNVDIIVDNGMGDIVEQREIDPNWNDGNKPIFFIGSAQGNQSLQFNFEAEFSGVDSSFIRQEDLLIATANDSITSERRGNILSSMLAFENLKDLFRDAGYDTAAIVDLAIKYNLLCDYTALIALEPNDTLHFMKNPFDESIFTSIKEYEENKADSVHFDIFPNPFNSQTKISIRSPYLAEVNIQIYNLRGQLVKEIASSEFLSENKTYHWDCTNSYSVPVSSGIYFVRVQMKNLNTNKVNTRLKRVLLIR